MPNISATTGKPAQSIAPPSIFQAWIASWNNAGGGSFSKGNLLASSQLPASPVLDQPR